MVLQLCVVVVSAGSATTTKLKQAVNAKILQWEHEGGAYTYVCADINIDISRFC